MRNGANGETNGAGIITALGEAKKISVRRRGKGFDMNLDCQASIETDHLEVLLEAAREGMEKKYFRLLDFQEETAEHRAERNYIYADISRLQKAIDHVEAKIFSLCK
jgi:hypothetical protein